jgi:hypothetical protein
MSLVAKYEIVVSFILSGSPDHIVVNDIQTSYEDPLILWIK